MLAFVGRYSHAWCAHRNELRAEGSNSVGKRAHRCGSQPPRGSRHRVSRLCRRPYGGRCEIRRTAGSRSPCQSTDLGLESARDAMIEADRLHGLELEDDAMSRARLEETARRLHEAINELRELIVRLCGRSVLAKLEMEPEPPSPWIHPSSSPTPSRWKPRSKQRSSTPCAPHKSREFFDPRSGLHAFGLRRLLDAALSEVALEARQAVVTFSDRQEHRCLRRFARENRCAHRRPSWFCRRDLSSTDLIGWTTSFKASRLQGFKAEANLRLLLCAGNVTASATPTSLRTAYFAVHEQRKDSRARCRNGNSPRVWRWKRKCEPAQERVRSRGGNRQDVVRSGSHR